MKNRPRMKLWEYPRRECTTAPDIAPTVEFFPLSTVDVRVSTNIDVCLEFFAAPPTREQAVRQLAMTFPDDRQPHVAARWQSTMLDGSPVSAASLIDLEVENVALAGWALDRHHRGLHNEGGWSWVQAAKAAHARLIATPLAA